MCHVQIKPISTRKSRLKLSSLVYQKTNLGPLSARWTARGKNSHCNRVRRSRVNGQQTRVADRVKRTRSNMRRVQQACFSEREIRSRVLQRQDRAESGRAAADSQCPLRFRCLSYRMSEKPAFCIYMTSPSVDNQACG